MSKTGFAGVIWVMVCLWWGFPLLLWHLLVKNKTIKIILMKKCEKQQHFSNIDHIGLRMIFVSYKSKSQSYLLQEIAYNQWNFFFLINWLHSPVFYLVIITTQSWIFHAVTEILPKWEYIFSFLSLRLKQYPSVWFWFCLVGFSNQPNLRIHM